MGQDAGRQFDTTHLPLDFAEERGFIHRDYLAHCLRWSHIAKRAGGAPRCYQERWLDIGCGKDQALARLLQANRLGPKDGYYIGVDINKLELHPHLANASAWQPILIGGVDVLQVLSVRAPDFRLCHDQDTYDLPTKIVSLEVLEHVTPAYCRRLLQFIQLILRAGGGTAFISTPCYDPHVGAADNHINEMTYEALGALLEDLGMEIVNHWGTFASQKDYKDELTPAQAQVFNALKQYYDSNLLAIMMAPLHPAHSRNCLWELRAAGSSPQRPFPRLSTVVGMWSSSPKWGDLNG